MKNYFYGFLFLTSFFFFSLEVKADAPTVLPLGDGSIDYVATNTIPSVLDFSELIATSSRGLIENSITNSANSLLDYVWSGSSSSTLTITSSSSDVTFYNDVKVANISDLNGSTTPELLLIDSALDSGQTEPDISGNATSSSSTPQVVVTSPVQEITMAIDRDTDSPSLDASALVLDGVGVFPKINLLINTGSSGIVGVYMPATTTITSASSSWDGLIAATSTPVNLPESYGQGMVSPGFVLGSTSTMLSFDRAVKILAPLQAGRGVVYTRDNITFFGIPTCGENSQTWADANLAASSDCKIDEGVNLVIWTKHFTTFATYSEQPKANITYSVNGRALKAGESLIITATFDQDLVNAPTITLTGANATSTLMATTSVKIFTYTHIIEAGNGTTIISLSSSTNASLANIVETPLSGATFQVDNAAPIISITSPSASERVKGTKVISFVVNELNSPSCSINNNAWTNCTSSVTTLSSVTGFDALSDGTFTLYLKDTDLAGNLGTSSRSIIKDTVVYSGGGGGSYYYPPVASSTIASSTVASSTVASSTIATVTPIIATTTNIIEKGLISIMAISEKIGTVTKEYIKNVIKAEEKLVKKVNQALVKRLAGRILLQTETFGQAWYLDPISYKRYYLADGQSSFEALRKFGLGIKNNDIAKIPIGLEPRFIMTDSDSDGLPDKLEEALKTDPNKADTDGDGYNDGVEVKGNYSPQGREKLVYSNSLVNRLRGRIILQTEGKGEAWYVSPVDGRRYYLANGDAAYQIMRYLSLGINNKNISEISVGE